MNLIKKVKSKLIKILLNVLTFPFIPLNIYLIKKYSKTKIKHQPIFIVGAPRTGSTIIYQSITNQADVLYIDNLICRLNHLFFIGFWLSQLFFKNKAHNCFISDHGNTSQYGVHAPSECGGFWYRWLPKDRHFIDFTDLEGIDTNRVCEEITAVSNFFDKPIVFKNLNAGQRMRLIKNIFPGAKFIFVKRGPFYTVQSILKAKRKLGIPDNKFWSIMPVNVEQLKKLSWAEQIVGQIYYIEKQIVEDSNLFPERNFFVFFYRELSHNKLIDLINKLQLSLRANYEHTMINLSQPDNLTTEEKILIEKEIYKFDWKKMDDK